MITTIGFDGDDTLWHFEGLFALTQARFQELLAVYGVGAEVGDRLLATEASNLALFGYGVKGFTLSMVETAIELTDRRIAAADIRRLIDFGKEMLAHPIALLEGAQQTVARLRGRYRLVLITKGDLFDQENKIARSGLADLFDRVAIVSQKDEATYARVLAADAVPPQAFLMVGNSMRSDVLPVLRLGGWAVHIPYDVTWAHEQCDIGDTPIDRFRELARIGEVPDLVARIVRRGDPGGRIQRTGANRTRG